jgi:hypothetical protein
MDISKATEIQATSAADALDRGLKGARDAASSGKTDEAAKAFEKMLATMLVHELSRGLTDGFFGDGPGADTFSGWFEEHMGAALGSGRGLGLAEQVRASLIQKATAVDGVLPPATEGGPELPVGAIVPSTDVDGRRSAPDAALPAEAGAALPLPPAAGGGLP